MNRKSIITALAGLLILATSCINARLDIAYAAQEEKIDTYIKTRLSQDSTFTVAYPGNATRLCTLEGNGEELREGGTVSFFYAGYKFTGSTPSTAGIFATNYESEAAKAGLSLDPDQLKLVTVDISESGFVQGLAEGLIGVKSGGEYEILFSGKYGYGNKVVGTIPANSALVYRIWVGGVSNR